MTACPACKVVGGGAAAEAELHPGKVAGSSLGHADRQADSDSPVRLRSVFLDCGGNVGLLSLTRSVIKGAVNNTFTTVILLGRPQVY